MQLFFQASKAAVISFYETLRVEIGKDVGITIVTPGLIESEMTQGKFLSREGRLRVDTEMRDVRFSTLYLHFYIANVKMCFRVEILQVTKPDCY